MIREALHSKLKLRGDIGARDEVRQSRQEAFERGMAQHHPDGAPPEPESDDALDERIAGWYAGDIDSVVANRKHTER